MNQKLKTALLQYIPSFAICAGIGWFYADMHDFAQQPLVDKYRLLCDACSLPGMLMILFALLMWVSSKGTLDALGFVGKKLLDSLIPGKRLDKEERYGDYVERQRAKKPVDCRFLYVVGGVCIAVSLVFLALFYSVQ